MYQRLEPRQPVPEQNFRTRIFIGTRGSRYKTPESESEPLKLKNI